MSIAGETIDYGPCAFMDAYDPGDGVQLDRPARPLRLWQPAAHRAVEPGAARRDAAAAAADDEDAGRSRRRRRRWPALRRGSRRPTARRAAAQARPVHAARGRRGAGAGPPERDGRKPGRLHPVLPPLERGGGRSGARTTPVRRCSPIRRPRCLGCRAGARGSARSRRAAPHAARRCARSTRLYIPRNHRVEAVIDAADASARISRRSRSCSRCCRSPYEDQPEFAHYAQPPELNERVTETLFLWSSAQILRQSVREIRTGHVSDALTSHAH